MTSLKITDADIPNLDGKIAIITGGASGIGFAAVKIISAKGGRVFILDLFPPEEDIPAGATFIKCDTASWADLKRAYAQAGRVDIAIANAGVTEEKDYMKDEFDSEGELMEPRYDKLIDVNLRGVIYFVKLALSFMRREGKGGSIVITSSATAYAPEQSLPVYSAVKHALIGLVRSLRSTLSQDDISINSVAPAATITKLLPQNLAAPLMAAGLPVSDAHFVALAIVYSATQRQISRVEDYGKDVEGTGSGRWNGRTILTLGNDYTELEGPIASLKPRWLGEQNAKLTRMQQSATDFRST